MITFNFELKKQPDANGLFRVYIRITQDRKLKRVATSVRLRRISDWNPLSRNGRFVKATDPDSDAKNERLLSELDSVKRFFNDNGQNLLSLAAYTPFEESSSNMSVLDYIHEQVEQSSALGKQKSRHYRVLEEKFEQFCASRPGGSMDFQDLTPAIICDFEMFLHTISRSRGQDSSRLSQSYVNSIMAQFRTVIRRAVMTEKVILPERDPFRLYKPGRVSVMKEKLEEYEIQALADLELTPDSQLWHTRNCFLFSFYCAGIRAADLMQLRWLNVRDGHLHYQMGKNRKVKDIVLVPQALQILGLYRPQQACDTDYIFPLLDSKAPWAQWYSPSQRDTMPLQLKEQLFMQTSARNVVLNRNLKKLAAMAGIGKNLSFHISRHSFAYLAMKKGVDPMIIKQSLSHSSLTTTERYLGEFGESEVSTALQQLFATGKQTERVVSLTELVNALKEESQDVLERVLTRLSILS